MFLVHKNGSYPPAYPQNEHYQQSHVKIKMEIGWKHWMAPNATFSWDKGNFETKSLY